MRKWTFVIFILLLMDICFVECRRGGSSGSSWSRGSSSSTRGSSSSNRGSSSGSKPSSSGWFSSGSKPAPAASKPSSSYGFQKPASKPVSSPASGWQSHAAKPASGSNYGWQRPGEVAKPAQTTGWMSSNSKPAQNTGWMTSNSKPATNNAATNPGSSHSWPKPPDAKPAAGSTYGWQKTADITKPAQNTGGWGTSNVAGNKPVSNIAQSSSTHNWPKSTEVKPVSGSSYGWQKPPENVKPLQNSGTFGATNNKPVSAINQPSTNVHAGSYPVQQGLQKSPSPAVLSPPHNSGKVSTTNTQSANIGTGGYPTQQGLQKTSGVNSSPHNVNTQTHSYHPAPAVQTPTYNGPKKQIINNHYHYAAPAAPAYTPSHYGLSSSYYPQQNHFGYPGGHYGNSQPTYGGLGLFSSGLGGGGYGYSGGGNWGGYRSYGSSSGIGSTTTGILIGAAGGYLASSLVNRISNPWNYHGHGYGYNYYDRYRHDDGYRYNDGDRYRGAPTTTTTTTTPAPPPDDPTKDWINCVAYNPATKETLINPNCTCSVTVVTDPMTGQNTSHHDCTPYSQGNRPPFVPQQPLPTYGGNNPPSPYGVNNPPPNFNGNLYGAGSNYGGGYPIGPTGSNAAISPQLNQNPNGNSAGFVMPGPLNPSVSSPAAVPSSFGENTAVGVAVSTAVVNTGISSPDSSAVIPSVQTGQLENPLTNRNDGVSAGNPVVSLVEPIAVQTDKPVLVESSSTIQLSELSVTPSSTTSEPPTGGKSF